MKNFSLITVVFTLFIAHQSFGQYVGELHFNINNSETDIIKNADRSREFHFNVPDQLTAGQKELIRASLESELEISEVSVQDDQWSMLVGAGTDKKRLLTHFIELGFKYISVDGTEKEILTFIAD